MSDKFQKTFRITPTTIDLYKEIEFDAYRKNNISKENVFNLVVNYSLDYIVKHPIPKNSNEKYEKRFVKGFSLNEDTLLKLSESLNVLEGINKGEFVEILIEIYAKEHLTKKEIKKSKFSL